MRSYHPEDVMWLDCALLAQVKVRDHGLMSVASKPCVIVTIVYVGVATDTYFTLQAANNISIILNLTFNILITFALGLKRLLMWKYSTAIYGNTLALTNR